MYISGILNQDGQFIPQQPVPQGYFDATPQQPIQANQGVLVSGYQSGGVRGMVGNTSTQSSNSRFGIDKQ